MAIKVPARSHDIQTGKGLQSLVALDVIQVRMTAEDGAELAAELTRNRPAGVYRVLVDIDMQRNAAELHIFVASDKAKGVRHLSSLTGRDGVVLVTAPVPDAPYSLN